MSAQPIDFSKYESQSPAAIDFSKYETSNQSAEPPAQPSAASRFGTNFLSGLGVTSNEDAKKFFVHPLDTVIKTFEAQGALAKKARDAYDRGDYMEALQHGLNYMVPFIGPQTDLAGTQLKQGDIAGGIGRTLGVAAPMIAGSPEARSTAGDAASALRNTASNAVEKVRRMTPRQAAQGVGAASGAGLGHGTLSVPGAYYGAKGAGALIESVLGKERANSPIGLPSRVEGGPAYAPDYQPRARFELDATGDNKPFAGGTDEPKPVAQRELDATGENKPFAGGLDEYTAPRSKTAAAKPAPRTVVTDPLTGRPEFSDVVAARQPAAPAPKPAGAAGSMAESVADPMLERLRNIASQQQQAEAATVPAEGEDLTSLLQKSIDMVKARRSAANATTIEHPQYGKIPRYVYRARDMGEEGVPLNNQHAQATSDMEQANRYAEAGQRSGSAGQVVKIDLKNLQPSDYVARPHPDGMTWVKFTRPLAEDEVAPLTGQHASAK